MSAPLHGQSDSLRKAVMRDTCGDPPDRKALPGTDEKWDGYLLGIEEAIAAVESWMSGRGRNER